MKKPLTDIEKAIPIGSSDFWGNRDLGGKVIDARDLFEYLYSNLTDSEFWFNALQSISDLNLIKDRDYTICDYYGVDWREEKVLVLSIHAALKIVRFEKKNHPKCGEIEAYLQEAYENWMDELKDALKILKQQIKGNFYFAFDGITTSDYNDTFPLIEE
jgi:phage anti-repressor protein